MEPIIYILSGILIGLLLFGAAISIDRLILAIRQFGRRIDALEAAQNSFFVSTKTDLRQYCDNLLAKSENKPQDIAQSKVRDTTEPPFFKNKQALEKAKAQIVADAENFTPAGPLAGMSTLDAFHEIDTALLELNMVDEV